jgi:FdhD protein
VSELVTSVEILRVRGASAEPAHDELIVEEPLELQVQGLSVAVTMRTPGHDEELALGFLLSEGIVASVSDVVSIRHCTTAPIPEAEGNLVRVVLREGVELPLERLKRNFYASSSCGICGKATIEHALAHLRPVTSELSIPTAAIHALSSLLRAEQSAFERTGGVHAAGLFDAVGELVVVREDVGRHNAVDKVAGALLRRRLDASAHGLVVSGRIGFEIVQKAAAIGLPIVVGISAPSSLAVRYAEALGVTVVGFARGGSFNAYAHPERIAGFEG